MYIIDDIHIDIGHYNAAVTTGVMKYAGLGTHTEPSQRECRIPTNRQGGRRKVGGALSDAFGGALSDALGGVLSERLSIYSSWGDKDYLYINQPSPISKKIYLSFMGIINQL